jgi:hypothetical protein
MAGFGGIFSRHSREQFRSIRGLRGSRAVLDRPGDIPPKPAIPATAQGPDRQPPQNSLRQAPMGSTLARCSRTPMRPLPSMDGPATMTPTATAKLNTALITLASQGSRPRCADPVDHQLWTSEDQQDRDTAATWCNGCQVLVLCHQAADERDERWGVWGGRDRSARPGRKRAARQLDRAPGYESVLRSRLAPTNAGANTSLTLR